MQIGRKGYYELSTGNVIQDTGERQGDVVETTTDQDFSMYTSLQPYQRSAVGCLQLAYGQDRNNFGKYPYHIENSTIVWDTANPIGASLADVQSSKIAQLNDMYNQTLDEGFIATIENTQYTFGWSVNDKANLNATETAVSKGFATFPFSYADVKGNPVTLNVQDDLNALEETATKFAFAQHQFYRVSY